MSDKPFDAASVKPIRTWLPRLGTSNALDFGAYTKAEVEPGFGAQPVKCIIRPHPKRFLADHLFEQTATEFQYHTGDCHAVVTLARGKRIRLIVEEW